MFEQKMISGLLSPCSEMPQTADTLQTDNTSSIITIGMEFEFLISKTPHSPLLPPKSSTLEAICNSLQNLFYSGGISIQTAIFPQRPNDQPDRSKFLLMDEKSCDPFHLDEATGRKIPGEAVEICTPILRFRSWEWVVPTVFEHLTGQFDCRFNTTTGLHVHIGRGCGWDLSAARSIAKAVIIFESALDHYHPKHRRPEGNWCIHSNRHNNNLKRFTKSAVMKGLDGAGTLQEGTVEFRQADAGVGVDRAVQWINLVVRFVTAAVETTPEEFERWARHECPAVCCPPEVFERFGVPWVGMREQVSHFQKAGDSAFGGDEWGIASWREREAVEEWGPQNTQTVQEPADPWTGREVREVSLRDNVGVRVGEGPKLPEDTPTEVPHTMIEDATHYLLSHTNRVETGWGL